MDDQTPETPAPRARRPRAVKKPDRPVSPLDAALPSAPAHRATIPATDVTNSDVPLKLSPDALMGTRDRLTAFEWMEAGHNVRRREDGVYECVVPRAEAGFAEPERYEYYPDVELLDRRVLDPSLQTEITILFKDEAGLPPGAKPRYYKRWVDTQVPSRLLTLTQRGGYRQAEWDMLHNKHEIGDRHESGTDRIVRRGEKGRYVLLFMPYPAWERIKTAQAQQRTERERTQMTRLAANQAAASPRAGGLGDGGAGDRIDTMFRGTIRELPPQSVESFQTSGLPKDLQAGGTELES